MVHAADRPWVAEPYLCSRLPGGGAELAPVIGWGTAESRAAAPRLLDPHGFALAWLRALPGDGVLTHRHDATQVLTVKAGHWAVTLNTGEDARTVELGPRDTLSVPPGAWRSMTALDADGGRTATPGTGELLVVTGGDGRVRHEWAREVVAGARDRGRVLDADGYLAPAAVLAFAAEDD